MSEVHTQPERAKYLLIAGVVVLFAGIGIGANIQRIMQEPKPLVEKPVGITAKDIILGFEQMDMPAGLTIGKGPECAKVIVQVGADRYAMPVFEMNKAGEDIPVMKLGKDGLEVGPTITDDFEASMVRAAWVSNACRSTGGDAAPFFSAMFCPLHREPVTKRCAESKQ